MATIAPRQETRLELNAQPPGRLPRGTLDRETVVAAALELADRDGLDGVTMARVADVLGASAMSLYRHVRDKQELLEAIADLALAEIPAIAHDPRPWRVRLEEFALESRRGALRHPALVEVVLDQDDWLWGGDVGPDQRPPETAEIARCREIADAAGEDYDNSLIAGSCETLFLLEAVADRYATVEGPAWLEGLEAIGTDYRPLLTFATRFGPGRHDGAAQVRDFSWDSGCSCFVYTGEPLPAD